LFIFRARRCFCAFKGLYCLDLRLGVKDLFMHKKHSLRALNIKITIFLTHILSHMVFVYWLPEVCNHPYFFFFQIGIMVCQATPRVKSHFARNRTHYLFPEYFQSQFYVNFVLWYLLVFLFLVRYIKYLFNIQKQILSF
jgi:hypothetical protein